MIDSSRMRIYDSLAGCRALGCARFSKRRLRWRSLRGWNTSSLMQKRYLLCRAVVFALLLPFPNFTGIDFITRLMRAPGGSAVAAALGFCALLPFLLIIIYRRYLPPLLPRFLLQGVYFHLCYRRAYDIARRGPPYQRHRVTARQSPPLIIGHCFPAY